MKKTNIMKEMKSFLLLWSSQAVSSLGTAMTEYALIVWVYRQEGTALSVTLLTLCSFAPTILFRFVAGAIADRWDKKYIMLAADLFAACGTFSVYLLYAFSALRVWHLYLINILLSFMNAFQEPAAFVATSLLVQKEHYNRVSGLQGFSGAAVSILAPALGASLLAFGGLKVVLICDLCSFFAAFIVLLLFIRIPKTESTEKQQREPFRKTVTEGFRFLHRHTVLLRLVLFMTCVNFLAKMGNDGLLSPFVLARTGDDQEVLGVVQSFGALGVMTGSLIVTWMKPVKNKLKLIGISTALVFSGNIFQSLSEYPAVWCGAAFGSYAMAAVMNAHMTVFMREQIPLDLQGRAFSIESTLKNCAIPLGLFMGGLLADHVFEPLMMSDLPLKRWLTSFFGEGMGAGIAVQFFMMGALGIILCLSWLKVSDDFRA
ncbi:MAG: MFS transporter [Clostridiales bacterium]|nr:MFS transporter [Clostridiales bacterium]